MTWKKVKLGDICTITKGATGIMKSIPGNYPMVVLGEQDKTHNEYQFDAKAVIIPLISSTGHGSATMKRVKYAEGKFALGTILCAAIPKDEKIVSAKYLQIYLHENRDSLLVPLMKGAANVTLSIKKLFDVEILIPSLLEQEAIVKKQKDLSEREGLLKDEITQQKKLLSQLKQSILQDAISGKLTEQWRAENPNTEPASELLKRIKAEKHKLIKEGKIRKEKPLAPITENEIPFEIPETWEWCRLGDLCSKTGSGSTPKGGRSVYPSSGIYFLRSQNVYNDGIILEGVAYISQATHDKMEGTKVQSNDLLLNITGGSIGRCAIVPNEIKEANINQHVAIIRLIDSSLVYYVHSVIISVYFYKMIEAAQTGAGREGLPKNKMDNILLPIPPKDEIEAIVTIVCNKLSLGTNIEAQIKENQSKAEMLSKSILSKIFENK